MDFPDSREVIVVDIKMRFWSMVFFMVKWVIASIPAILILTIIWAISVVIFQAITGGGIMWHGRFFHPSAM